jgi:hypothetical protein
VTERYAPQRAFPPYAYLPGRDPHPVSDPAGHSHRTEPEPPAPYLDARRWRENGDYLFGADLYNAGFLWEAHEVWEGLWHSAKHDAVQADFLQGLIQCSAASLKVRMQQPAGVAKLTALGLARLERVAARAGRNYMGLDLPDFVARFRAFAAAGPETPDARPRVVLA